MTTATQAYAFGNCTYYIATRFPSIYAWLGNAKDWIGNARKQGYQILQQPAPDTVVVYGPGNGYSALGHVAVVESVNGDGSFQVSEMNYRGWDVINQRRSTMKGVIGFIVPPGSSYHPPSMTAAAMSASSTSGPCVYPGPVILGSQICLDGAVGVIAMVGGSVLILAGIAIIMAFALNRSGLGTRIKEVAPVVGGPYGALLSLAQKQSSPKPKVTEQQPSAQEAKAASSARVARAKARVDTLSPDTQAEVAAARRGEGKKLSPTAKEELRSAEK